MAIEPLTSGVRKDMFPAELIIDPDTPDRQHVYPVRVVVTLDEVLVFKDSSKVPVLVFRDELTSYSPPTPVQKATRQERKSQSYLWAVATTESGHALTWKRSSGCGCGSKLKALSLQALLDNAAVSDEDAASTEKLRSLRSSSASSSSLLTAASTKDSK